MARSLDAMSWQRSYSGRCGWQSQAECTECTGFLFTEKKTGSMRFEILAFRRYHIGFESVAGLYRDWSLLSLDQEISRKLLWQFYLSLYCHSLNWRAHCKGTRHGITHVLFMCLFLCFYAEGILHCARRILKLTEADPFAELRIELRI